MEQIKNMGKLCELKHNIKTSFFSKSRERKRKIPFRNLNKYLKKSWKMILKMCQNLAKDSLDVFI